MIREEIHEDPNKKDIILKRQIRLINIFFSNLQNKQFLLENQDEGP